MHLPESLTSIPRSDLAVCPFIFKHLEKLGESSAQTWTCICVVSQSIHTCVLSCNGGTHKNNKCKSCTNRQHN